MQPKKIRIGILVELEATYDGRGETCGTYEYFWQTHTKSSVRLYIVSQTPGNNFLSLSESVHKSERFITHVISWLID